jgi:hypothetical protein
LTHYPGAKLLRIFAGNAPGHELPITQAHVKSFVAQQTRAPRVSRTRRGRYTIFNLRIVIPQNRRRFWGNALALTGFAVGITAIALCLAGSFVLKDAGDAVFVSQFACVSFSVGSGFEFSLALRGFGFDALLLFDFQLFALKAASFTSFRNCSLLCLSGFTGRLGSFFCGTKSLKKSSLGFRSSATTVGDFIVSNVSNVSQISIPVDASRRQKSGFFDAFWWGDCRWLLAVFQFFRKTRFSQPNGLFFTGLRDGVKLINRMTTREKLSLRCAERNLGLFARLAMCISHWNSLPIASA